MLIEPARAQDQPKIETVPFLGHSMWPSSAVFSPDGAHALSGGWDRTLKLWDVATGALIRTFQAQSDRISSVAFSPDGARVLSGCYDGTLKLWDAATGAIIRTFRHSGEVTSVAFSPLPRLTGDIVRDNRLVELHVASLAVWRG
jgi:WD40 repeat protein